MNHDGPRAWRALFVAGGLLYCFGGFNHPRGVMAEMLVDPAWIPSHSAVFVGVLLQTLGLMSYRRSVSIPQRLDRWLVATIVLAALETAEMGLHTIAYLDAEALGTESLIGGPSTPILTTHIWFATLIYTPFAVALIGLIWIAQRERLLGSPWIGWIGILGAVAHGSVMWLAIWLAVPGMGILFPIAALATSLWFVLAGFWPTRTASAAKVADARAIAGVAQ